MATVTDTVNNLAVLAIVGIAGFVLLRFQDPLEDVGRTVGDVAGDTVRFVTGAAGTLTPAGARSGFTTGSSGQTSGGPRIQTAGRAGNLVRDNLTGPLFGAADPGYVRREGGIVAVDEFGKVIESIPTLKPGDMFGSVRYTGTGFD